jgi:hypothetical protein
VTRGSHRISTSARNARSGVLDEPERRRHGQPGREEDAVVDGAQYLSGRKKPDDQIARSRATARCQYSTAAESRRRTAARGDRSDRAESREGEDSPRRRARAGSEAVSSRTRGTPRRRSPRRRRPA